MSVTFRPTRLVIWMLVFVLASLAGVVGLDSEAGNNLALIAILLWISGKIVKFFRKNYANNLDSQATKRIRVRLSPLMGRLRHHLIDAHAISSGLSNTGLYVANPTYNLLNTSDNDGTEDITRFGLEYLVMVVDLQKKVPHIFVDGLAQNIFTAKQPNLWSLSKLLSRRDRLQDLEGDFPDHFRVYAADKGSAPLAVLAPDVMRKIRDQGIYFDYELYDQFLYIYCENRFETPGALDAYLRSTHEIIPEIVDQVKKQSFSTTAGQLRLSHAKLKLWATLYSGVVVVKVGLTFIALVLYMVIVNNAANGEL